MDKAKEIFSHISKREKKTILFDRIDNLNYRDIKKRILSYPQYIIDEFLLNYSKGYFSDFIYQLLKNPRNKKKPLESNAFKVFTEFSNNMNLETRKGQNAMIEDIEFAIDNNQLFIGEAPPGTGKSIAYLLPVLKKINDKKRIIISTNTKNLQSQIFKNDLTIASNYLRIPFSASIIKGISNYLCFLKYEENKYSIDALTKLALEGFIFLTQSGDLTEFKYMNNLNISQITAENEYCMGKECPFFEKCYFMKIKNQAKTSDIVLTNHYFLLIDKDLGQTFLGDYGICVFDEAHNLENVISEVFNYRFDFKYILNSLYQYKNMIHSISKNINNKFKDNELKKVDIDILNDINILTDELLIFFNLIRDKTEESLFKRFEYKQILFDNYVENILNISNTFNRIIKNTKLFLSIMQDNHKKEKRIVHSFNFINDKITQYKDIFSVISNPDNEEYAFYYEKNTKDNIVFYAVPIDTGEIFARMFIKDKDKIQIFISATLGIDEDFSLFFEQIGLNREHRKYINGVYMTSFDWQKQMKIKIINEMGNPNTDEFIEKSAKIINIIAEEKKKTLVLTTSYEQINKLKDILDNKKFLFQRKEKNGEHILEKFIKSKHGVIIGTSKFWEGVDLPGELLERIIILKMPFAVPNDPLVKKRSELIENQGKNAFMEYILPNAILRLKQGIGRLIRKRDDMGIVYVLDERIVKKQYGHIIVDSLFVKPEILDYSIFIKENE